MNKALFFVLGEGATEPSLRYLLRYLSLHSPNCPEEDVAHAVGSKAACAKISLIVSLVLRWFVWWPSVRSLLEGEFLASLSS